MMTATTLCFVILISISLGDHCDDSTIRGVDAASGTDSCVGVTGGSRSACCGRSCQRHPSLFSTRGGQECQRDSRGVEEGVSLFRRPPPFDKPLVLLLDVDNTLYSEAALRESGLVGVEEQIVRNIHSFALRRFNLTVDESDELHRKYGSTIEGIRQTLLSNTTSAAEVVQQFYEEVYGDVDVSPLLAPSGGTGGGDVKTGYSDSSNLQWPYLRQALNTLPCPLYFVSNSPHDHVMRVLTALGLRNVPFEAILTPDSPLVRVSNPDEENAPPFPTKANPKVFYRAIEEKYPTSEHQWMLLDDSLYNLRRAASVLGIRSAHISPDNRMTLQQGLGFALGHLSSTNYDAQGNVVRSLGYIFDEVQYLRSKNMLDLDSMNPSVWNRLIEEMSLLTSPKPLRIVDLGAGLFSMLKLMIFGHQKDSGNLTPLFDELARRMESSELLDEVVYEAYESNVQLMEGAAEALQKTLGFQRISQTTKKEIFEGSIEVTAGKGKRRKIKMQVHLHCRDYRDQSLSLDVVGAPPHLIVGSCFADLFDPRDLVPSLLRFSQLAKPSAGPSAGPLVYFPITFAGTTSFVPSQPFIASDGVGGSIPSDTAAFRMYAASLVRQGHNIDPESLVTAMKDYGATLLCRDASDWYIDPSSSNDENLQYLWNTMLYFFGSFGGMEMMMSRETTGQQWDVAAWVERARRRKPAIRVSNADLLFRLPALHWYESHMKGVTLMQSDVLTANQDEEDENRHLVKVEEIQFFAPHRVGKIQKEWDAVSGSYLGPSQVEIQAVCSLISSGTELKIFKGMFEEAALDVNIKSMAEETMKYPLAYGYSMVGIVTKCGSDVVDASSIIGRLVFTFSPHASHAIADRDSIQIVPEGIEAEDAIFMPSVETALSLVHDANVRIGEKVAVYGQGLIGLLVTSILSHGEFATSSTAGRLFAWPVTAFDVLSERLSAASEMGASSALPPSEATAAGPFDVSIEVSGNGKALQSAIDNTANGGRVIVGSWYGNKDVKLKLGIDFHRSHKKIQTSQVSTIPAELSGLWTKGRRFALTWQLVRMLRPSRLVSRYVSLDEAQEAYELLDAGKVIAIAFRY